MKSPGILISPSRVELAARLASVMQASQAIRSEVALTICESSESRLASQQLRMDSARATRRSSAWRQGLHTRNAQRHQWIAHAIVQVLSKRGYSVFLAEPPQDTASVQ
jgi:hypothetical protein